jgi:hypothetical protein
MPIHDWTRVLAGIFHDFHHSWIEEIKRALNRGLLPPEYYALAEQIAGGLGPDVLALEAAVPNGKGGPLQPNGAPDVSRGTLLYAPPTVRFRAAAEPQQYARKRKRVVIRHSSDDRVVAMIEVVSPGNKASRQALRSFVEKALELLEAGIHLVVLDLFPPGPRDPQGIHAAIWSEIEDDGFQLPPDKKLTLVSYSAGAVKQAFIEPVAVGDVLLPMPLFLEPDGHVLVPLEATYQAAFEAVPRRWQIVLSNDQTGA